LVLYEIAETSAHPRRRLGLHQGLIPLNQRAFLG
jgi:hypothetical protein